MVCVLRKIQGSRRIGFIVELFELGAKLFYLAFRNHQSRFFRVLLNANMKSSCQLL